MTYARVYLSLLRCPSFKHASVVARAQHHAQRVFLSTSTSEDCILWCVVASIVAHTKSLTNVCSAASADWYAPEASTPEVLPCS